ncbi:segregation/condensation protein A [Pseudenhygromyxa sp. WMMC2535]|uniref:segregation/condensation protein A n=1 Tax=Pseudenhygromyxa sp. WMMC2535 TaxID=2712867 RepID=UPI0015575F1B|nr:segregation/condensation protein A [Pseudenhygromyxa sp. WMMC2535]NVB42169.1 segregation/condensation protein A [Pseudenhygromyxa sp. WMMC2535]
MSNQASPQPSEPTSETTGAEVAPAASTPEHEGAGPQGSDSADSGTPSTAVIADGVRSRESYAVSLEVFEGPLDLLLHLVRRHELDILDIPISFIATKYIEYISFARSLDIEIAGEYLVMAATLAFLKSRELLPPSPEEEEEGEEDEDEGIDPREELIRRLIEYERFREAGAELDGRPLFGRDVFPRGAAIDVETLEPGLAPVTLFKLAEAYSRILDRAKVNQEHEVVIERVTIRQRMVQLGDMLAVTPRVSFEGLFLSRTWSNERELRQMLVVTLMSVLEMVKLGVLGVHQAGGSDALELERVGEVDHLREVVSMFREEGEEEPPLPEGAAAEGAAASAGLEVVEGSAAESAELVPAGADAGETADASADASEAPALAEVAEPGLAEADAGEVSAQVDGAGAALDDAAEGSESSAQVDRDDAVSATEGREAEAPALVSVDGEGVALGEAGDGSASETEVSAQVEGEDAALDEAVEGGANETEASAQVDGEDAESVVEGSEADTPGLEDAEASGSGEADASGLEDASASGSGEVENSALADVGESGSDAVEESALPDTEESGTPEVGEAVTVDAASSALEAPATGVSSADEGSDEIVSEAPEDAQERLRVADGSKREVDTPADPTQGEDTPEASLAGEEIQAGDQPAHDSEPADPVTEGVESSDGEEGSS